MMGRASYRYRITDAGRAARGAVPRSEPLRRRRAGAVRAVPALHAQFRRRRRRGPPRATASATRSRIWSSASPCSTSSVRRSTPGTRCSCTALRETARPSFRRPSGSCSTATIADSARDRGRGGHHPDLRSGQSRADRAAPDGSRTESRHRDRHGPPLGTLPAADGHGRRRADARRAGAQLQPDDRVLSRAGSGDRERRRAGHRRLRPPAVRAARPVEPLDRAAREPGRLPDAAVGAEVRAAVHGARDLRDQHQAGRAGGRGVPAPHPLQGVRREPDGRGVHADLRELLPRAAGRRSTARLVQHLLKNYYEPRKIPLRGCQPRDLHRPGAFAGRVPRRAARRSPASCSRRRARAISSTSGRPRSSTHNRHEDPSFLAARAVLMALVAVRGAVHVRLPVSASRGPLSVRITSPLGRLGIPGTVRIVAQIQSDPAAVLSPVQFYVDGKLLSTVPSGPPYAAEWVDENPFEQREIAVAVADSLGNTARDKVVLKPLEIAEATEVSRVLLDASVQDKSGRFVNALESARFPRPRGRRAADARPRAQGGHAGDLRAADRQQPEHVAPDRLRARRGQPAGRLPARQGSHARRAVLEDARDRSPARPTTARP